MQYQLKFKERRSADRKKLTGLLPGRLKVNKKDISCRPIDVSAQGLGILSTQELAVGTLAELLIGDQTVQLEVAWCRPDVGKKDMWRYGMVTKTEGDNIEEIFIKTGCLR